MEKYYWYSQCVNCNQGRLILTEDTTNKRMYLHCEECERGWLNPQEAHDNSKGFLALEEDFETDNPNIETITIYGWKSIAMHSFSE
ncbi:hypothetical protein L4D06_23780 [Enterovibrio makurazakiensis]|uniref:Uncharacterized protein n=1 Tax=Enterovibrio gelatinilyticus TaxID=2899819 RepID=A0ABT5R9U6_9GAMM|nr:hypothetical protein [Enterovibrio sp. ZSDZ42]MDD1796272.1 hypothetical protein [Enterovibrio sp. ZSDZ42]